MPDASTRNKNNPVLLGVAFVTVAAILGLLCYRIHEMFAGEGYRGPDPPVYRQGKYVETEDGWKLLWATGPIDVDEGEWFDVRESPLDSLGFQFGIGKDLIRAIDNPEFVSIDNTQLLGQASIRK